LQLTEGATFCRRQIETPDEKRGRVSAIDYCFVGASNTLDELESGMVAASLDTVPSVVIGRIGSLLVAAVGCYCSIVPRAAPHRPFQVGR